MSYHSHTIPCRRGEARTVQKRREEPSMNADRRGLSRIDVDVCRRRTQIDHRRKAVSLMRLFQMAGAKRPVRLDWIKEGYNQVKSREKENKNESEKKKRDIRLGAQQPVRARQQAFPVDR